MVHVKVFQNKSKVTVKYECPIFYSKKVKANVQKYIKRHD